MRRSRFSQQEEVKALSASTQAFGLAECEANKQPLRTIHRAALFSFAASLALATLLIASQAHAKLTLTVDEATVSALSTNDFENNPLIYGGVAGYSNRGSCTTATGDSTCNNCDEAPEFGAGDDRNLKACNNRRIYGNLALRITISSDTIPTGKPLITTNSDTTGGGQLLQLDSRTPQTVSKGQTATIYVLWSEICNKLDSANGANCEITGTTVSGTLKVGISGDTVDQLESTTDDFKRVRFQIQSGLGQDSGKMSVTQRCTNTADAKGICSFEIGSGDNKATIKKLGYVNRFP